MIRIAHDFAALVADDLSQSRPPISIDMSTIPTQEELREATANEAATLGLEVHEGALGRLAVFPDGRLAPRRTICALAGANAHEPLEAARQMMRTIANEHGPGVTMTVSFGAKYVNWRGTGLPLLALISEGGAETVHVIMAAYYAHSAEAMDQEAGGG